MINIEELSFHDTYITGISIKTKEDHFDRISLFFESDDFVSEFKTNRVKLIFIDCYKADMQLQMWITGKDSIRELKFINSLSDEFNNINEMQEKGFIQMDDIFKHCEIVLNTSASKIKIIAKDVRIEKT